MYRIGLVCENGASTGMVVRKMIAAAEKEGIEANIKAYPYSQLPDIIGEMNYVLFGPQLGFKLEEAKRDFPEAAKKINIINVMDFGMMNGEKILKTTIDAINNL